MKLELLNYFLPLTKYPYVGEFVTCSVCSSNEGTQVAGLDRRWKRLASFACSRCGLLYTNPMPTEEELDHYYTSLYRLDYQGASSAPKIKHLHKRRHEAEGRCTHLQNLLKPNSRTLDFGCGSGEFITSLLSAGHDAHGFEPGSAYGNYARSLHGDRVKVQSWQNVSYDSKFDLVSCFHVLEHLRSPMAALKQMVQWTQPDGFVYIEVPDMGTTNPNKGFGAFHLAHLFGFNHHNLILAGLLAGLRPKFIVSKTGIIFEHGATPLDPEEVAAKGRKITESLYGQNRAFYSYFRYQLGKLVGQPQANP